jgi:hypothetical protein
MPEAFRDQLDEINEFLVGYQNSLVLALPEKLSHINFIIKEL